MAADLVIAACMKLCARKVLPPGAKTSTLGAILACSGQGLAPSKVTLNGVTCLPLTVKPARR